MARPARRIAVVGPTHPYHGGISAHTTHLARRLQAAGHDTRLVSWLRLYPTALYPTDQAVPDGPPDVPPFPATTRPLRWDRPATWTSTGVSLRAADVVVIAQAMPVQVPALLALVRAIRGGRGAAGGGAGRPGRRPDVVVLAHNVLPHEPHVGESALVRALLRRCDRVLVHSADQARLAAAHGARDVRLHPLPPHLPGLVPDADRWPLPGPAPATGAGDGPSADGPRLLALGIVRRYKGIDVLLEAVSRVPEVRLTVAGEQWGEAGAEVSALATTPALAGRVDVRPGYVPSALIPALVAEHDVVALPYRSATASQNVQLAFAHGRPVLATRVGTFAEDVEDGVDGLLVAPGDAGALAAALRRLAEPGVTASLRAGVRRPDLDGPWKGYLEALLHP